MVRGGTAQFSNSGYHGGRRHGDRRYAVVLTLHFSTYIFCLAEENKPHWLPSRFNNQKNTGKNKNALVCGVELVPIFRDPGSPSENVFFLNLNTIRFGGDWIPYLSFREYDLDS